jgi:hypothetical protein
MTHRAIRLVGPVFVCIALLLSGDDAQAQNRVGGHFGAVFPLVTRARDTNVTIGDDFVVGFPTGITVRGSDEVAFDLELVPVIQNEPLGVSLTVHPGVLAEIADQTTLGLRMAFDVNQPSWGFTPLLNYGFARGNGMTLFGEVVVPIRFQEDFAGSYTSVGVGAHIGIGF